MRQVAVLLLGWMGLLCGGCLLLEPRAQNPFDDLTTVAILPFFNVSDKPGEVGDLGRRFALAYFAELQKIPGFDVLPPGIAETAIIENKLDMNSPAGVLQLAELLRVDAVVVGSITDYDPFYPPRIGLKVSWYSPYFWPVRATSEPLQTDAECQGGDCPPLKIPDIRTPEGNNVFRGQSPPALEPVELLGAVTDRMLVPPIHLIHPVPPVPLPSIRRQHVSTRNEPRVLQSSNQVIPLRIPDSWLPQQSRRPIRLRDAGQDVVELPPNPTEPGEFQPGAAAPVMLPKPPGNEGSPRTLQSNLFSDSTSEPELPQTQRLQQTTKPSQAHQTTEQPVPQRDSRAGSEASGSSQFVPTKPFMSYTRLFDGKDPELVSQLRDYVELTGDARSGGWKGYLQRSEDFMRFACHMMIVDMLSLHGGAVKTKVVFKLRKNP